MREVSIKSFPYYFGYQSGCTEMRYSSSDHSFLIPFKVAFHNVVIRFSGTVLKLSAKSCLLTPSNKSQLSDASKLQLGTQCTGSTHRWWEGEGPVTGHSERERAGPASAGGEMRFPEIIRSFSGVMETMHHTCVRAWD